ncbi:phage major capsid protein [Actinospica sp. MGRD01-02]|uniref:Phage major capsid protein n=1 Tax=Actinospica acidithermotolerans TaxID=2828514 RepID=A0A941EH33_9ACTN|nr:phage major capsid protein [Actinospica acidithermotolerans]MBR7831377.1 phage major capsid protein [Actinospica acidithermotolerans]
MTTEIEMRTMRAAKATKLGQMQAILDRAKRNGTALTSADIARFDALESEVLALNEQIRAAENPPKEPHKMTDNLIRKVGGDVEQPSKASQLGFRWYAGPNKGDVYRRDNGSHSYFLDLARKDIDSTGEARKRLETNSKMRSDAEARAGISTVNGSGGEFVPPLWLEEDFISYARPGRPTANLCQKFPLPAGTDTINLPKVATGTAVAPQVTQNTGVQETDITTTSVASPVITIAGGQTVSLQLVEQSPINIDMIVLQDLAKAYAVTLNGQILSGSGASGNLTGLLTLSGTNAVTFSGTALTGSGSLYSAILKGSQLVQTGIFLPADSIIMHPRRWSWMLEQVDTLGRPIIPPRDGDNQNSIGVYEMDAAAQGYVGTIGGLRIYTDATIPTNLGAGTNQDAILVARMSENYLWESDIRAEAFQQTYAQNMSVYVRLYNYAAFQPARYPAAMSVINGTGLNLAD